MLNFVKILFVHAITGKWDLADTAVAVVLLCVPFIAIGALPALALAQIKK